ncbi:MAG TPA: hypothetical protein VLK29_06080, partial [Luteimonas sp.]|nr:hypothetical protein [Luteimonas sp.]
FSRGLAESNALYEWTRDRELGTADGAALRSALVARQSALVTRAESQVTKGRREALDANARIQSAQDDVDRAADRLR